MADTEADRNWWCDYCQRGKTGYPPLPDDVGVADLGGELLCDECDAPTITAVAQYDCPDGLVWLYYRDGEPPATETIRGAEGCKQDQNTFEEPVDVPTATDVIEAQAEAETVTLVPPFDA